MNSFDPKLFEFDQRRVLDWWTGRMSDQQLADFSGLSKRNVQYILSQPYWAEQVQGGGRGSKHSRRVTSQLRNAVAILASMNRAGLPFQLGTEILSAIPRLASEPTEIVDFHFSILEAPTHVGPHFHRLLATKISPIEIDPSGNWLPTDIVPAHVWNATYIPYTKKGQPLTSLGDIYWFNSLDPYIEDRAANNNLVRIGSPSYIPDLDPFGTYYPFINSSDNHEWIDHKFLIADGRYVFSAFNDVDQRDYLADIIRMHLFGEQRRYSNEEDPNVQYCLEAEILEGGSVKTIDSPDQKLTDYYFKHHEYQSLLEINSTNAVKKMKRIAYHGAPKGN